MTLRMSKNTRGSLVRSLLQIFGSMIDYSIVTFLVIAPFSFAIDIR